MDKTDNTNIAAKLAIRRYMLRRYHGDGSANVMDCCQGDGMLWRTLRSEFPVAGYWGLDLKAKRGRLRVDSSLVLAQKGWSQNVIDIDTYGSPWEHWRRLLPNVTQPLTVFLTVGVRNIGTKCPTPTNRSKSDLATLGLDRLPRFKSMSIGMRCLLTRNCGQLLADAELARAIKFCEVVEAAEAATLIGTRYIGVRIRPLESDSEKCYNSARAGADTPAAPKRRRAKKEPERV